jgi:pimeloyl-ACP methyl ester carboxylesterase
MAERWTSADGIDIFYRESANPPDARVMIHLHGFGLSGRYLLPTAELLADEFHTLVPDLPGAGRSGNPVDRPGVTELGHATASFMDALGIESATLVGNSLGCAVICEVAYHHPERVERAVLVAPAGGIANQPFRRAVRQISHDGLREPTSLLPVAVPDYLRFGVPTTLRLFKALTQYPALERLLALHVPTLAVLGTRDPLMPSRERIREVATQTDNQVVIVVIDGAAHAINFSHPAELAHIIRAFMDDKPIDDVPGSKVHARVVEIHRGSEAPPAS